MPLNAKYLYDSMFPTVIEPAASIISGGAAEVPAGLSGILAGLATGSAKQGARASESVQRALTYEPKTAGGKISMANVQRLVQKVIEVSGIDKAHEVWRQDVVPGLQKNMGPAIGGAIAATGLGLLNVIGGKFGKLPGNVPKGMRGAIGGGRGPSIGSFLNKKFYPNGGLGVNPIHEVKDWAYVRSLVRAARKGQDIPPFLIDGPGGSLLTGTHRAAANDVLRELGDDARIGHLTLDDLDDDLRARIVDAVENLDYSEIDALLDRSNDSFGPKKGRRR